MIFLNLPTNPFSMILLYIFFICIKIAKNLSAKYYQENKERLQKKLMKDIKIFLKKNKKKKKQQFGCKRYKNLSEDKKQKLVEWENTPFYNYRKHSF